MGMVRLEDVLQRSWVRSKVVFSHKSDDWATPKDLYERLDSEFSFDIDAAANEQNHKCDMWFGLGGYAEDALALHWPRRTYWLNPPYSRCREFMAKAAHECMNGSTVVCLVPSRTDTRWWHEHVWDRVNHKPYDGIEVRFVKGRLKFEGATAGAPFPSAIVVLKP